MANNYAIRVKDVTKMYKLFQHNRDRLLDALGLTRKQRYQEHYALRNVSFDISYGETVGIIGINGAGKSTILKIITGVLSPTEGEVEINGRISALLELGAGFNGEYTGIENIYLNGTMMGYSREEVDARMDDILKFADIGDFVNQPVKKYSSGMFVRLAFALAINIDPEILVVDEALSVGDVFFQAKCYQKFEEFKREGKTILFVSHDLSSITKYCDRVVLLHKGEMLAEGTPKEMVDLYKKILTGSYRDRMEEERKHRFGSRHSEAGQSDTDQSGKGLSGAEKPDAGQTGHGSAGEGQSSAGLSSTGQKGAAQPDTAGRPGTGQDGTGRSETDQSDAGNLGEEQKDTDGSGRFSDPENSVMSILHSDTHGTDWKYSFAVNPLVSSYGSKEAEIVDFSIRDEGGNLTDTIIKGSRFTIRYRVYFHHDVQDPIFTFTFKTIKGTDVTGTNSMLEKKLIHDVKAGTLIEVSFAQDMSLQGGEYLLSISCTGFENGELKAYHRLYDLLNVTVISDKNTVGFYDMESEVEVKEVTV